MKKNVYKKGDVVVPLCHVPGYPVGLSSETRCVVREVNNRKRAMVIIREDGRDVRGYLMDFDAVRRFGG